MKKIIMLVILLTMITSCAKPTEPSGLEVNALKQYAQNIGLDTEKFNECLDSGSKVSVIQEDMQLGQQRGVKGTPSFYIEGTLILGFKEEIRTIIDQKLQMQDYVVIEEFSDAQCPACRATEPYVTKLKQDYGDKVKIEFKHFPLSFHQYAQKAAEAMECANEQDMFWEYKDLIYGVSLN